MFISPIHPPIHSCDGDLQSEVEERHKETTHGSNIVITHCSSFCPESLSAPDYHSEHTGIPCILKLGEGEAHPDGAFSRSSKVGLKTKVTSIDVMNSTEPVTTRERENKPSLF